MATATASAETLPINLRLPRKPIIDLGFTSRHAAVQVRTGSFDAGVEARIDLCIEDGTSSVSVDWRLTHSRWRNEANEETEPDPLPHGDMSFGVDEIEAFAAALYEAVHLARKAGYLPTVTSNAVAS